MKGLISSDNFDLKIFDIVVLVSVVQQRESCYTYTFVNFFFLDSYMPVPFSPSFGSVSID